MIAIVFPGQGSQKPGMGQSLYAHSPAARDVFDRVDEAAGIDVAHLCFHADEDTLRQTQNAQLALYTCGVAAHHALKAAMPSLKVAAMAGHSVGEYAALAASGVISIAEGANLVKLRGEIMAASGKERPGTMAAVLGLDRIRVEEACQTASHSGPGVAVVANDNCPGQIVISGDPEAVQRAGVHAQELGAKRVLPLNVSGAFHSPLMESSGVEMGKALQAITFDPTEHGEKIFANVTASPVDDPVLWSDLLEAQLKGSVRWAETIEGMKSKGITTYIECGVGEVLLGLIKRMHPESQMLKVNDEATLEATLEALSAVPA